MQFVLAFTFHAAAALSIWTPVLVGLDVTDDADDRVFVSTSEESLDDLYFSSLSLRVSLIFARWLHISSSLNMFSTNSSGPVILINLIAVWFPGWQTQHTWELHLSTPMSVMYYVGGWKESNTSFEGKRTYHAPRFISKQPTQTALCAPQNTPRLQVT